MPKSIDLPTIRLGDSVWMRQITESDGDALYDLIQVNYDYLHRFVYWVQPDFDRQDERAAARENYEDFVAGTAYVMGVYVGDRLVGAVDVHNIRDGIGEVGYWLSEDVAGKGLATTCAGALMGYVQRDRSITQFELFTAVENTASNRVAHKLGFVYDKQVWSTGKKLENYYVKYV